MDKARQQKMSEKVLGFRKKDAYDKRGLNPWAHYRVPKGKLVPVVSLEWLEKECRGKSKEAIDRAMKRWREWMKQKEGVDKQVNGRLESWESGKSLALDDLLSAAKKEAEE